jgi:diguanylate cyclase (GGDEF)-like protein/PAS domain S-box-containing protein
MDLKSVFIDTNSYESNFLLSISMNLIKLNETNKDLVFNTLSQDMLDFYKCDRLCIYFTQNNKHQLGDCYTSSKPSISDIDKSSISNIMDKLKTKYFNKNESICICDTERKSTEIGTYKSIFCLPIYTKKYKLVCCVFMEFIENTYTAKYEKDDFDTLRIVLSNLLEHQLDLLDLKTFNQMLESVIKSYYNIQMKDITTNYKTNFLKNVKLHSKVFNKIDIGITMADTKGVITDVNEAFLKITGYEKHELIGKNPSILQSKWHDKDFYESMWKEIDAKGFFQGELWDRKKNGELYISNLTIYCIKNSKDEIESFLAFSQDVTKQKEHETQIKNLAFYDPLTQLANRNYFNEELEKTIKESLRTKHKFVLMFLDLDGFKSVNDTNGHIIGDKLLQKVAHILKSTIRSSDFIARVGGDEFIILLKHLKNEDIDIVASKIIDNLSRTIIINNAQIHIGCSIGISEFLTHGTSADELIDKADIAMYKSKQNGKNQFTFYGD